MGISVDGAWLTDEDLARADTDLRKTHVPTVLRHWVTPDGAPGPSGEGGFKAEAGRYHLYVAWNCPWAHRTLILRAIKRLEGLISFSCTTPARTDQGWVFDPAGEFSDQLFGAAALHEIYTRGAPGFSGRVTVPVLFDKATGRIVNNESADIARMLNNAFAEIAPESPDCYPEALRPAIDGWNAVIHQDLNKGVYRAGFATTQAAYEVAATTVFRTLDLVEAQLAKTPYLCGDRLTEADCRLLPTLVRFDVGYYSAFKCNLRRIADYPHLSAYVGRMAATPGLRETIKLDIYRCGYHSRSDARNPSGVVPVGPLSPAGLGPIQTAAVHA